MTFTISPINETTLEMVVALLWERTQTLPEYTRWKYLGADGVLPRGLVAHYDDKPLGCFGLVPRELRLPGGECLACGWFADWYVAPQARGSGVGVELLRELSSCYAIIFGHPGPAKAQQICLANGYSRLAFQSRRLLQLRRWQYERRRTHYLPKAALRFGRNHMLSAVERLRAARRSVATTDGSASLIATAAYSNWMFSQPTHASVQREVGKWCGDGLEVSYIDDRFKNGDIRRRVMFTAGEWYNDAGAWAGFFAAARQAGCVFTEIFTTEPATDRAWQRHGALRIPEAPVLVNCTSLARQPIRLHGWDRENWSILAW